MYDSYQMKNKKFREQIHECLGALCQYKKNLLFRIC